MNQCPNRNLEKDKKDEAMLVQHRTIYFIANILVKLFSNTTTTFT